jgi:monoamine oxidase
LLAPAPLLTGWSGGDAAKKLERGGERIIRREAVRSLAAILGTTPRRLRPWIAGWQRHDWTRDPFARGAYSFNKVGSEKGDQQLAEPVAHTLFFAGEAAAENEPGTVHGAMESGFHAARLAWWVLRNKKSA